MDHSTDSIGKLIVSVAKCTSRDLLGSWITLRDLCRLDSAFCSKSSRHWFLEILAVAHVSTPCAVSVRSASWLSQRNIKLSSLVFSRQILNDVPLSHKILMNMGPNLKCIEFKRENTDGISESIMCDIALYTKKLKVLNLGGYTIPTSLAVVLIKCDSIVELNIAGCMFVSSSLLTVISESCPNLHVLNVVDCYIETGAFDLVTKVSSVRKLTVGNSGGGLSSGFFKLCHNATELIVWHSPRMALSDVALQLPYVTKFSVFATTTNFELYEAKTLTKHWPNLVCLTICAIVSENFAVYTAQNCLHLQHLSLSPRLPDQFAANFDCELVEQPASSQPLLTACFGRLTSNNMCLLLRKCSRLVRFEVLDLCPAPGSVSFDSDDESESEESESNESESDESESDESESDESESDESGSDEGDGEEEGDGVIAPSALDWDTELLTLTLPTSLHTLSIQNCALFDNRHLVFLRGLTSLSLAGNNTVTDEGIIATLAQNPALRVLRIRDFKLVTHVSVLAAVRSCPLLAEIEFSVRGGAVANYVQRELILGLIHELRPGLKIVDILF